MSEWKTIESAPKQDNTSILVYRGDPGFESHEIDIESTNNSRFYSHNGFTHRMPLPFPPKPNQTNEETQNENN